MPSSSFRPAPSLAVGAVASLLALAMGLPACGSGAQCAIDSDCQLGLRCNAEHQCVARGSGDLDAASEEEDSGPRDDAGTDAPIGTDAFSPDAPVPMDAPIDDANDDADLDAFDSCPALAASYSVTRSGAVCMSNATVVSFRRLPGETCSYELTSDRRGDVEGVMAYSGTGTSFSGGLNFPDVGRPCTLESVGADVFIVCGACSIDLSPM